MKPTLKPLVRLALIGVAFMLCGVPAKAQTTSAFLVLPEFANVLINSQVNPPNQSSAALFSGTLGAYSPPGSGLPLAIPTNSAGIQLAGCSFGQMLARSVPFPNFETETIRIAQTYLYAPTNATTREQIAGSPAAFRYKELLYTNDGANVRAAFEGISAYFGNAERQQARDGIEILRQALKYSPLDKKLRNALLDAYYDFIVAEAQFVKSDLATVAQYRLGLAAIPPGDFIIDHEIAGYTNILNKYGGILDEYGKLFLDRGGIDVSQVDATAPVGITLGEWIFQQEQPQRNQMAAQFRDAAGNLTTVPLLGSTSSTLFAGYKDYVALLGVMRDYAQSAAELARLYGMRGRGAVQAGQKDDKTLAYELIDGNNRELLLDISLLNSLLPNAIPPASGLDASGVRSALAGVLTSSAELDKAGLFLSSQVNVLGYDPDFLALISTFDDSSTQHRWDSYDALRGWLDYPNSASSILGRARKAFDDAYDTYDTYRGHADQVFIEMSANESTYAARYREICGYDPDELPDAYPSPVPAGRYPPVNTNVPPSHMNNPRAGSELRQAQQSIEQSNAKSDSLATNASLLDTQLVLAEKRLDTSSNRTNLINEATKTYQGVITTERNTITKWSADQAETQAIYDTASDMSSLDLANWATVAAPIVIGVAGAINIAEQYYAEQHKGDAERNLDLAAADFDKSLALADTDQNVFQAGEEQRNIEREKQSHVLTAQDNGFVRDQGMEQIDGLQREMQQAKTCRDQNNSDLAGRYYADPIHFLRAQNSMIQADFAFQSAQRWVFLALRALEYKYNQPFVYTEPIPGSPRWELASLFRLRNADELDDLLAAMDAFNLANLGKLNGRSTVTDKISLKDDVWGQTYTNQADRLAEFRKNIAASYDAQRGVYVLKLNTLRLSVELENGSLFSGAEYGLDGSLITKGFYLDKIEWIKVKFVDSGASSLVTKTGDLSYGGTCFVRPERPSCIGGGLEATNELRSFPFRYFSMGTDPNTGVLKADSSDKQQATINYVFWNQPDKETQPSDDYAATFWKERSVAITDLNLTIAASKVNTNTLQDVQIYIRHLFALRTQCQ
jgi:hypothetical protein